MSPDLFDSPGAGLSTERAAKHIGILIVAVCLAPYIALLIVMFRYANSVDPTPAGATRHVIPGCIHTAPGDRIVVVYEQRAADLIVTCHPEKGTAP